MSVPVDQERAVWAAIEGLTIHGETCGHRRHVRDCPFCDDTKTAEKARVALRAIVAAAKEVQS